MLLIHTLAPTFRNAIYHEWRPCFLKRRGKGMSSRMSSSSLPLPHQFSIVQLCFTCCPKPLPLKSFHDSVSVLPLALFSYPWKLSICCSCPFCAWKGQVWNSPSKPPPLSLPSEKSRPSPYTVIRSHSPVWLDLLSDLSLSGLNSRTEIKLGCLPYHACYWTPWLWLPGRLILLLRTQPDLQSHKLYIQ